MKQLFTKKLLIAALVLTAVPMSLFAQNDKEKEKDKSKDYQQITITRDGNKDEKTVIEIDGDKVKINGKDAADNKDVRVRVNRIRGARIYATGVPRPGNTFSFEGDGNGFNFFNEDPNRPMLGVVTEGNAKGAEVQSVSKESAAEKAGLKKGDIITRIENKKIESTDDVTETVRAHKPGDKINITVLRDGKEQKLTAELGKWKGIQMNAINLPNLKELELLRTIDNMPTPPQPPTMIWRDGEPLFGGRPRLGMSIQDTEDGKGAKVLDVDGDSNASKAGIQKNDIITEIDGTAVNSADEVARIMRQKSTATSVRLQVLRNGKTQTIEIKTPRKLKTVDL